MTGEVQYLTRDQIDSAAWEACVAASSQSILYGYSWYLDAVLAGPSWKWIGLVLLNEAGQYQAVMPVPLRRKYVGGIAYRWVVHQPFFCQMLGVFSRDSSIDTSPFFKILLRFHRYGSILSVQQRPPLSSGLIAFSPLSTHVLDLSVGYTAIYQNYSHDRKQNLRRAIATRWTITKSTDLEPLLTLFQDNHAEGIPGGVAVWAYTILKNLITELQKRRLVTLRYATCEGQIEAGALFVREGNRIIYLFNSASAKGRRGNARTLLIDQIIQEYAGQLIRFDFESPDKQSIRDFYQSFGAVEEAYWMLRWNRLNRVERGLLRLRNKLKVRW